ncbi:MFS transporter [Gandjariella thermophila]|uniref:MFS transporter n=1 Tax=Gandjariella thermophila TaxID=1931992 RepID=UPI001CEF8B39|nr:MFS transporter [Gandjariella thermophila]
MSQSWGVLRPYRQLARIPHLPALLGWSLLGRLHVTGTALALSFLIAGWTGSYTLAGVVGGALALGQGLSGPSRGRSADRRSAPRLLVATGLLYGAGLAMLGVLPALLPAAAWPVEPLLALLTGLAMPPVSQVSRAAWPRLASGAARESLYAVEATLVELVFAAGPVLISVTVALAGATAATALCGGFAVLGALGFAGVLRRAGLARPVGAGEVAGPRPGRRRSVLLIRGVLAAVAVSMFLIAALEAVDMVVVAWARDRGTPATAGVLGAAWALGSAAGGLIAGGLGGTPRLPLRAAGTALGVLALVPVLPPVSPASSPWLLGVVLAVGGMAISPALAANNSRLSALAPEGRRAEVFGWVTTAITAGPTFAAPLAGWLLDRAGAAASAGGAAVLAVAATLCALAVPGRHDVTKVTVSGNDGVSACAVGEDRHT